MNNVFEVIANHYGLQLDEAFEVVKENASCTVAFKEDGLYRLIQGEWLSAPILERGILSGNWTVKKLPFRPKYDENYYYLFRTSCGYAVHHTLWKGENIDFARAMDYGIYKDEKGANEKLKELKAELGNFMRGWR